MGIFEKIRTAIFGSATANEMLASEQDTYATAAQVPPTSPPSAAASAAVDISAILDQAVKAKGQKLKWKTSVIDLMKTLDLDSSLSARKKLAKELNYPGDTSDSAKMNTWLHKALTQKLSDNGGKIPDDLKN